jgi:hypothetical protein
MLKKKIHEVCFSPQTHRRAVYCYIKTKGGARTETQTHPHTKKREPDYIRAFRKIKHPRPNQRAKWGILRASIWTKGKEKGDTLALAKPQKYNSS